MPEPTTIEELRDWHARRAGWTLQYDFVENLVAGPAEWRHDDGRISEHHPIADTIDAAVLAFPEGWVWSKGYHGGLCPPGEYYWAIRNVNESLVIATPITGHTPTAIRRDLLALARLAWIAEGATP